MYTKQEIASCLLESAKSFLAVINRMKPEEFSLPVGKSAWSPAQHMDHLSRASAAIRFGLMVPRFILRAYGKPNRPGRTYDEVKKRYRERLEQGGAASGRFIPAKPPALEQQKTINRYRKISEKLLLKVSAMKEEELDAYLLPHPLLGKVTIREMLFFAIYHTYHHLEIVQNHDHATPE